ncbi:MAG: hypothetical protein Q9170_005233 [Blastenia crenularia]
MFSLHYSDTENGQDMNKYGSFAMLPSMRVLSGSHIARESFGWAPSYVKESSTVTEINIDCSATEASAFELLLSWISGLQKFTCHYGGCLIGDASYSLNGVVDALRKHVASTLTLLYITAFDHSLLVDEDEGREYIGSLKLFSSLELVALDDVAIQRSEGVDEARALRKGEFYTKNSDAASFEEGMDSLVNDLSALVEFVTLVLTMMDHQEVQLMFDGLLENKAAKLPRLKETRLEGDNPLKEEMPLEDVMMAALREAGVTLTSYTTL